MNDEWWERDLEETNRLRRRARLWLAWGVLLLAWASLGWWLLR